MAGGFNNPLVGDGGALAYPSIHSPNYVAGSVGWTINEDGSVEFNNGIFRGTVTAGSFIGSDFEINQDGSFYYNGTPANGNLFCSIASNNGGTDRFGNAYQGPGFFYYSNSGDGGYIGLTKGNTGFVYITIGNTAHSGAAAFTMELSVDTVAIGWGGLGGDIQLSHGSPGYCTISSPVFAIDGTPSNPTLIQTDSWTNMTLQNSFGAGIDVNGTSYPPQYRLTINNEVEFRGVLVTPGTGVVTLLTLTNIPYHTSNQFASDIVVNRNGNNAGIIFVRNNGNVQLNGSFTNSNNIQLDGCKIPLN